MYIPWHCNLLLSPFFKSLLVKHVKFPAFPFRVAYFQAACSGTSMLSNSLHLYVYVTFRWRQLSTSLLEIFYDRRTFAQRQLISRDGLGFIQVEVLLSLTHCILFRYWKHASDTQVLDFKPLLCCRLICLLKLYLRIGVDERAFRKEKKMMCEVRAILGTARWLYCCFRMDHWGRREPEVRIPIISGNKSWFVEIRMRVASRRSFLFYSC